MVTLPSAPKPTAIPSQLKLGARDEVEVGSGRRPAARRVALVGRLGASAASARLIVVASRRYEAPSSEAARTATALGRYERCSSHELTVSW